MPLIDLREHFGLWERCGNTFFWRELGKPDYNRLLVNPVAGVMILGYDHPYVDGPAIQVTVRDASDADDPDIRKAYERNYPWVKDVLSGFFSGLTAIRIGFVRETPEEFFLKYYVDQTKEYKETGEGHSDTTGKDELLTATKRILVSLGGKFVTFKKTILRDEWDDFLEGYGIIEC